MFKKIGISLAVAAMALVMSVPKADAKVRIGVSIGTPAYTYPVTPYYDNYNYYAPQYVQPYYAPTYTFGWSSRDHDRDRHERRERYERWRHEQHERREHNRDWRR